MCNSCASMNLYLHEFTELLSTPKQIYHLVSSLTAIFNISNCLACRYWYWPKFYNRLPAFLEKSANYQYKQSFIIRCRYFSCRYLFVSLWHCSHMSLPYILPMSDDGLMFFCFSFCRALGLLLCLKSKKHNMDVSAGNGQFWQQNIIQDRKSFITQSKLMIFW